MKINPTVQELDELIAAGRPVIIDLYGEWCMPCKMMAPIFEKVAAANSERAEFVKIDVDVRPELAERYGVMKIPSIIGISGGEVRHSSSGTMNEVALNKIVDALGE